jgi:hypothetical protein
MDARRSAPVPGSDARHDDAGRADREEPPPFFRSWGVLYTVVIGELLLVIALCYGLSRWGR